MKFDIMTLFPEMVSGILSESILGRAQKAGLITVRCHNIRDYSEDKHRRVDDTPYGGGKGMLMAASDLAKFMPMMPTAAGMIKPCNALICGVGVLALAQITVTPLLWAPRMAPVMAATALL